MKLDFDHMPVWLMAMLTVGNSCFIAAYILGIRRGFKEQIYCFPMVGTVIYFAWDISLSSLGLIQPKLIWPARIFVLCDLVLAYQFLKYARKDFIPNLSPRWIVPVYVATFAAACGLVITLTRHFDDEGWHAAYVGSSFMSILFPLMLLRRNSVLGQSIYIAGCKWIASVITSISFFYNFGLQPIVAVLAVVTTACDTVYVGLVFAKCREQGLNPWARA